jgi:hypothetical protein
MKLSATNGTVVVVLLAIVLTAGIGGYHLHEQRFDDPCESLQLSIPMAQFQASETDDGLRLTHQVGDVYRNDSNFVRIDVTVLDNESGATYHTSWRDLVESGYPIESGDRSLLPFERIPFDLTAGDELDVTWVGYNRAAPDHCEPDPVSHTALDATRNSSGEWVTNGPWPEEA